MKTTFVRCMTIMAIVFWVSGAAANSIDVDFDENPGAHLTIYDNDQSSGGPDQVLFSFTNDGPLDIASITIDDNGQLASFDSLYNSQGVDFIKDGEGGGSHSFSATTTAGGINGEAEFLGIIFELSPGVTLASLYQAISDDILKIVPDFRLPGDGGPDSFLPPGSNPVPEPASLILFGIGTAGLAGLKRRRRSKR